MLKSKQKKRLLCTLLLFFLFGMGMMLLITRRQYRIYEKDLILSHAQVVGSLLKHHPELEDEIIDAMLEKKDYTKEGMKLLSPYGLDQTESYDVIRDLKTLEKKMEVTTMWMVLLTISGVIVIFIFYIRSEEKKIEEMNQYMSHVFHGDYSLDIRDYEEGDLSHLKNEIYKMTVLLKEKSDGAMQDKLTLEETLSDISHQLKTPLTSMYVMNDLLMDEQLDPNMRKEFLIKNHKQLERIEWLVTSLLKLSRMENGTLPMKKENISVSNAISKAVAPLQIPMELKNQTLKITGRKRMTLIGDEAWLVEALLNIIKNAHEHTREDGVIQIHTTENPIYKEITIEDNGCGIVKEDIPHLFERFYKAKTSKNDSVGIGLHLAHKIITKMNGEITVTSEPEKGTVFHIKFYK